MDFFILWDTVLINYDNINYMFQNINQEFFFFVEFNEVFEKSRDCLVFRKMEKKTFLLLWYKVKVKVNTFPNLMQPAGSNYVVAPLRRMEQKMICLAPCEGSRTNQTYLQLINIDIPLTAPLPLSRDTHRYIIYYGRAQAFIQFPLTFRDKCNVQKSFGFTEMSKNITFPRTAFQIFSLYFSFYSSGI